MTSTACWVKASRWGDCRPGGFIAVFGVAIVAMEFRAVAVMLDRIERFGRDWWARLRGKKRGSR